MKFKILVMILLIQGAAFSQSVRDSLAIPEYLLHNILKTEVLLQFAKSLYDNNKTQIACLLFSDIEKDNKYNLTQLKKIVTFYKQNKLFKDKIDSLSHYLNVKNTMINCDTLNFNHDNADVNETMTPQMYLTSNINIDGKWRIAGFDDYSYLMISRLEDNKHLIRLENYFNNLTCYQERSCMYDGFVLVLNKPIMDCHFKKYTRIYTIKYLDKIFLLPEIYVNDFFSEVKKDFFSTNGYHSPSVFYKH